MVCPQLFKSYWASLIFLPTDNYDWVALPIGLAFAAGIGGLVWHASGSQPKGFLARMFLGAIIFGAAGFGLGFFGPIVVVPSANQGPLLGFVIGPVGCILGSVAGFIRYAVKRA